MCDSSKQPPLEIEYSVKIKRALNDIFLNSKNPNFIDIESEDFEPIHLMLAIEIVKTHFEEIFIV